MGSSPIQTVMKHINLKAFESNKIPDIFIRKCKDCDNIVEGNKKYCNSCLLPAKSSAQSWMNGDWNDWQDRY